MVFIFVEAMNLQSFQIIENNISEVLHYRDYIVDLYGVKDSTMSNYKCAMLFLILSPSFLYHPHTLHSLILRNFFIF